MGLGISIIIACISGTIGLSSLLLMAPDIINGTISKRKKYIRILIGIIGLAMFISFLICAYGDHPGSSSEYKEVPIEKLTTNRIYFEEKEYSLSESYIIIEEPDRQHNNVVVIEKNNYVVQWIYKFKSTSSKYHVYLTEETYERLRDGNMIYENKEVY